MFSTTVLLVASVALGLCWAALASWVLGSRYVHDRAVLRRTSDAKLLEAGSRQAGDLSARRRRRIAVGPCSPASTIAARSLVRAEPAVLLRRAAAGARKSARLRALTIVVRSGSPQAIGLLRAAARDDDASIVAAVVRLTSELPTRSADLLLLDVLVAGRHPRSRTATELEPRSARISSELVHLSEHPDATLRFWAVTLLGREPGDVRVASALALRAGDDDPSVRAAAAEALVQVDREIAAPILHRLLDDNVFYVRAHAARGIGESGLDELADDVLPLLADSNWWVRAAAKESLLALGTVGFRAAVAALEHADRFARDGALEIVVGSVHLQDLLAAAELGDPEATALAATIAARRAPSIETEPAPETPRTLAAHPAEIAAAA